MANIDYSDTIVEDLESVKNRDKSEIDKKINLLWDSVKKDVKVIKDFEIKVDRNQEMFERQLKYLSIDFHLLKNTVAKLESQSSFLDKTVDDSCLPHHVSFDVPEYEKAKKIVHTSFVKKRRIKSVMSTPKHTDSLTVSKTEDIDVRLAIPLFNSCRLLEILLS